MTTFTLNLFNNRFENKKENVRLNSIKYQENNIGRTNDCDTPFRNPYNHWRKTSTCGENCLTNTKVLKDNISINFEKSTCYNPYIKSYLNKNGIRDSSFIYSYQNILHKNSKSYEQNSRSAIYTNDSSNNMYVVTPDEKNNNSPLMRCHKTVIKYRNKKFLTDGAVSGRSRIARLKYNTELLATAGNAVNGKLISIQGNSHYIRPPYRNNKNIDSGKNIDCSKKGGLKGGLLGTSKLRCSNSNVSQNAESRKAFNLAKNTKYKYYK